MDPPLVEIASLSLAIMNRDESVEMPRIPEMEAEKVASVVLKLIVGVGEDFDVGVGVLVVAIDTVGVGVDWGRLVNIGVISKVVF